MKDVRVHIIGMGIVTPLGKGCRSNRDALLEGRIGIGPLNLFPTASGSPLPVGEVSDPAGRDGLPRTHRLALAAAEQAMDHVKTPPDAVVMGVTTGGLLATEGLLKENVSDPDRYRRHGAGSVAGEVARVYGCRGPVFTVSTACSSGAASLKIALELIRSGRAARVLAGGADCLCRLTYHGFNTLQLIDPDGARPMDADRRGMTVGEGAAMLLLAADEPECALAELLGGGLSCDAYHPTAPHPEGEGALSAMRAALSDAGIRSSDIDYVNLHGTGTRDNDAAEARAVNTLFGRDLPMLSSVKGAGGHSLAAAGAIEAVVAVMSISNGVVPANTGCRTPDPELNLMPLKTPVRKRLGAVLSNSFGFGGNNAALVLGAPGTGRPTRRRTGKTPFAVMGHACITGAGRTRPTMDRFSRGDACGGVLDAGEIAANLSPALVRRLKRFPRLALSLAMDAHKDAGGGDTPRAVFMGTGWGALSETHDFLDRLFTTNEQFPSPTDFIGSVHNAAAGQIAMQFKSTGANLTMTGGDYAFEQALAAAELMSGECRGDMLIVGADENHPRLSGLFDPSVAETADCPADGGGALYLRRRALPGAPVVKTRVFKKCRKEADVRSAFEQMLADHRPIDERFGVVLAGLPAACRKKAEDQLETLLRASGFRGAVIDYRKYTGDFASASAVAVVMAVNMLKKGRIPGLFCKGRDEALGTRGALVVGMGDFVTAVEVTQS